MATHPASLPGEPRGQRSLAGQVYRAAKSGTRLSDWQTRGQLTVWRFQQAAKGSAVHIFIFLRWSSSLYHEVLFSSALRCDWVLCMHTSPLGLPPTFRSRPSRSGQPPAEPPVLQRCRDLRRPASRWVPPDPSLAPSPRLCSLHLHVYSCLHAGSSAPSF